LPSSRVSAQAGDRVEIARAFRQPVLAPSAAAILGAEQLTEARDAVDLIRVARMHHHRHHRCLGLDPMVEALPGLADIVAAVDRPVGAARRRAEGGIHDLGVVRRDADVAAVGQRREPVDLHVLPMLASIVAAEEPHAVRQEHGAGCGGADSERMAVEHTLDLGLAANPAPIFGLLAKADQISGAVLPALAAVAAAHRAVGLERGIDVVGGIGVDSQPHDPTWERHDDPIGQRRIRHLAPSIAPILAAIDAGRRDPGIDDTRVFRVDGDRPGVGVAVGQAKPLPARPAVGAAVGALGGPEIDHIGVIRMDRDRVDVGLVR